MTTTHPAWFQARQKAAQERYEAIPTPKRGDEQWRFSNIKQLSRSVGVSPTSAIIDSGLIARSTGIEKPVAKFIFQNDTLIHSESQLPEAVICLSFAEALVSHPELVEEHFMKKETRLGSAKYAALHEASVTNGLFVHVPDHIEIEGSIEVHHWIDGESTIFPHTLIVTGKSSKVTLIDVFRSVDDSTAGFVIGYKDLFAGENSALNYIVVQDLNEVSRIILIKETSTSRDARSQAFILNTGAAWARNESFSQLLGPGAHSDMLSVSLPHREQEYDQRTLQHHVSEGTYSDLLYKNTLYGHSKTVFSGLISVDEKAHHTDAYQTCRNLLMTDDCEANSMPGLEINADQVKCSHGSTSSQISDEEIFYLCARGIEPSQARQLIARGFSVEVVERLKNDAVETFVLEIIDRKLSAVV
jgi:Fe-S cluster assembly protein SufD